jgi:hypothetical protein
MKKRISKEQELESAFIRDWAITIIDLVYLKYQENKEFIELAKEAFSKQTKMQYLQKVSPGVYLKGLRQAFNDINEMVKDIPKDLLDELNALLREKFGKDLRTYSKKRLKQIGSVLRRGKILDEDEFRLIEERVSELCQLEPQASDITGLNNLLSTYISSTGRI